MITTLPYILALRAGWRLSGHKIVFTNGCFDLFHTGHVKTLLYAALHGSRVIVAVNSDESVRKSKGEDRPIVPLEDRMEIVNAIRGVDFVISFDAETPLELVRRIRPDVLVKGAEYPEDDIAGSKLVKEWGGSVVRCLMFPDHSTSQLVNRIRGIL
jgi:rfaE bifunctional protein nucleotidyltransferase chain/domain